MKEIEVDEVVIKGVTYVPKNEDQKAETFEGMEYELVRTYSAGVFAGYVESKNGKICVLRKARRIWYWSGAASLSQLAVEGTSKPSECKFPCEVDKIELTEAIEYLTITQKAKESISSVPVWSK